jgi:hypothetical protein
MSGRAFRRLEIAVVMFAVAATAWPAAPTGRAAKPRSAARRTPTPTVAPNRAPEWPKEMKIELSTSNKYDDKRPDWLLGATTTITISTPATDPDGDPISYTWTGAGVGLTTSGPTQFEIKEGDLKGDGLTATWWRESWSGEPASGFISVTAKDGKGGEGLHLICIGRYVQCP